MRKTWRFVRKMDVLVKTLNPSPDFHPSGLDFYSLILGGSKNNTLGGKYSGQPILGRNNSFFGGQIKSNSFFLFPSFWQMKEKQQQSLSAKSIDRTRCIPSLRRNAKPRRQKAWEKTPVKLVFLEKLMGNSHVFCCLAFLVPKKNYENQVFCVFLFTHRNFKDS